MQRAPVQGVGGTQLTVPSSPSDVGDHGVLTGPQSCGASSPLQRAIISDPFDNQPPAAAMLADDTTNVLTMVDGTQTGLKDGAASDASAATPNSIANNSSTTAAAAAVNTTVTATTAVASTAAATATAQSSQRTGYPFILDGSGVIFVTATPAAIVNGHTDLLDGKLPLSVLHISRQHNFKCPTFVVNDINMSIFNNITVVQYDTLQIVPEFQAIDLYSVKDQFAILTSFAAPPPIMPSQSAPTSALTLSDRFASLAAVPALTTPAASTVIATPRPIPTATSNTASPLANAMTDSPSPDVAVRSSSKRKFDPMSLSISFSTDQNVLTDNPAVAPNGSGDNASHQSPSQSFDNG